MTRDQVVPAGDAAIQVAGCEPEAETDGAIDHSQNADSRSAPTGLGEDAPGVEASSAEDEPRIRAPAGASPGVDPRGTAPNGGTRYRHRWAELLQRVFGIDALRCPRCGSTLRLIAAIEDPDIARKILECLKLPARAPPLEPATADTLDPGQADDDWLFDPSPTHHEP